VEDFENYLLNKGLSIENISKEDFYDYSEYLVKENKNDINSYYNLYRYGYCTKNKVLLIDALEVFDGEEVIRNMHKKIADEFGIELRDEIFKYIDLPPLGIHPNKKPAYAKKVIDKMLQNIDKDKCKAFLNQGMRDKYSDFKEEKELFLARKDFDSFLTEKHQKLVEMLTYHRDNNLTWFAQDIIDDEVLDYVKNNQMISTGIRQGDKLLIEKIPFKAKKYLNTESEKEKRYYYCHCPWARETLLTDEENINPIFCNCSAGFHKAYWEAVLGQTVSMEVKKSVLSGDMVCQFEMKIPENVLDS